MKDPKRVAIGRMGAHAVHAAGKTNTAPARAAREQKFYDLVDPDGLLSEEERESRVAHAKSLHYAQMRRKRGGGNGKGVNR